MRGTAREGFQTYPTTAPGGLQRLHEAKWQEFNSHFSLELAPENSSFSLLLYPVTPLTGVETNGMQFTLWSVVLSPPPLVLFRRKSTPEALGSLQKARGRPKRSQEHRRLNYARLCLRPRPQNPELVSVHSVGALVDVISHRVFLFVTLLGSGRAAGG